MCGGYDGPVSFPPLFRSSKILHASMDGHEPARPSHGTERDGAGRTSLLVDLVLQLRHLAGKMQRVAIHDRCVPAAHENLFKTRKEKPLKTRKEKPLKTKKEKPLKTKKEKPLKTRKEKFLKTKKEKFLKTKKEKPLKTRKERSLKTRTEKPLKTKKNLQTVNTGDGANPPSRSRLDSPALDLACRVEDHQLCHKALNLPHVGRHACALYWLVLHRIALRCAVVGSARYFGGGP